MTGPRIRVATVEDAPLLARLNRPVQDLHAEREGHLYIPWNSVNIESFYLELLQRGEMTALIAETDEGPAGLLLYRVVHREANPFRGPIDQVYVDQLSVLPEARRRGVGAALMEAAHAEARRLGGLDVELDVRAFNQDAIRFYEALGYRPVGLRLGRSTA